MISITGSRNTPIIINLSTKPSKFDLGVSMSIAKLELGHRIFVVGVDRVPYCNANLRKTRSGKSGRGKQKKSGSNTLVIVACVAVVGSRNATPAGFDHVLQATLLDAEGRVYRQLYGDQLNAASLGEPLTQLLRNAPLPQRFRFEELIDRVRILCTEFDPATGKYRVKYGLLLEVAGGVTFALAMLWFFFAEWRMRRLARRAALDLSHNAGTRAL